MYTYLGDTGLPQKYQSLFKNAVENGKINEYEITTENGSFRAYKAKNNGVDGYIYCNNRADAYEFCTPDEVIKEKMLRKINLSSIERIDMNQNSDLILASRKNKEIDTFNIEFYNSVGNLKYCKDAREVEKDGVKGYIFDTIQVDYIGDSEGEYRDKKHLNFVPEENLVNKEFVGKRKFLTVQEQNDEMKLRLQRDIEERILNGHKKVSEFFDIKGIKIEDFSFKNYKDSQSSFYDFMVSYKRSESMYGEIKKDIDVKSIGEAFSELNKATGENLEIKMLEKFGITLNVSYSDEDDEIQIQILDKNKVELSNFKQSPVTRDSDYTVEYEDDEYLRDEFVSFSFIDVGEDATECEEYTLTEKNKNISIEDSKFKDIYELIATKAFTNDPLLIEQNIDCVTTEEDYELDIVEVNLSDKLDVSKTIMGIIEELPEDFKVEMKSKMESKSSNTKGRKFGK